MSTDLIRHAGRIAPGLRVSFCFDPASGRVTCEHDGPMPPPRAQRAQALRAYKAIRYEFLQRVAATLGASVSVVDASANCKAELAVTIASPRPGRA